MSEGMPTTLGYGRHNRSRAWRRNLLISAVMPVVGFMSWMIPVRTVETRIDAVTGSTSTRTIWLSCITTGQTIEVSPLEARLKEKGIPWSPASQFLSGAQFNAYGKVTSRESARAPSILQFRPLQEEFMAASTDEELQEFVNVMEVGTPLQQEEAISKALVKLIMSGPRRR